MGRVIAFKASADDRVGNSEHDVPTNLRQPFGAPFRGFVASCSLAVCGSERKIRYQAFELVPDATKEFNRCASNQASARRRIGPELVSGSLLQSKTMNLGGKLFACGARAVTSTNNGLVSPPPTNSMSSTDSSCTTMPSRRLKRGANSGTTWSLNPERPETRCQAPTPLALH